MQPHYDHPLDPLSVLDEQTFYPYPEDDDFRDRAEEAYNEMLMRGGDL